MSSIGRIAGTIILILCLMAGARSQRQSEIEGNGAARRAVETAVRASVAGFNPYASLRPREPGEFELVEVQITRHRVGLMIDSLFANADRSYEAYARYRASGQSGCMSLLLVWRSTTGAWSALRRPGVPDRCDPSW